MCVRRRAPHEGHEFIVFFLNNDERQSVDVGEVEEANFFEVTQHPKMGGSVFITRRRKPRLKIISRKVIYTKDLEDLEKGEEKW